MNNANKIAGDIIRQRAYYRYLHRVYHNIPGDDKDDWYTAEKEYHTQKFIEAEECQALFGNDDNRKTEDIKV